LQDFHGTAKEEVNVVVAWVASEELDVVRATAGFEV